MLDPRHPIAVLAREDGRFPADAYVFVFDALTYAHNVLGLGGGPIAEEEEDPGSNPERHLSGQQLCEAIRQYALEQYGFLARSVFESWGITRTGDFGEIVYSLIEIGQMRKTDNDRREDFENVYNFADLVEGYQITLPE